MKKKGGESEREKNKKQTKRRMSMGKTGKVKKKRKIASERKGKKKRGNEN